ncbi:MAG: PAS domain-containing protein, partial [Myxococcota bacterium]
MKARPIDPIAEGFVGSALGSIHRVIAPAMFSFAIAAIWLDHPNALLAALILVLVGIVNTGLALWWWHRPMEHAHRNAALIIASVQLTILGLLFVIPDPVLATLQVIVAVGAAFFLIDLRWMLSVQAFGIAGWLVAFSLYEPTLQWQLSGLIVLAGYTASGAFYLGRVKSMDRIRQLTRESEGLDAEAQKSAKALRASEARLRNAQRIAHMGSYEWDIDSNKLHWSDEHYRIFGWEPGETAIDNALFFGKVHPDDRDALAEAVAETLRDGSPIELEFRIVRTDGEERVLFGRGETTRDESGKAIRHTGTSLDITEQHRAEAALRKSES